MATILLNNYGINSHAYGRLIQLNMKCKLTNPKVLREQMHKWQSLLYVKQDTNDN